MFPTSLRSAKRIIQPRLMSPFVPLVSRGNKSHNHLQTFISHFQTDYFGSLPDGHQFKGWCANSIKLFLTIMSK